MFSSPLQPLDQTPATLVSADCPRPLATTYPACQRCVVMFWESSYALQNICTRTLQSRESMVAPPWTRYQLYRTMSNIAIFEPGSNSGEGSWSFVINRVFLPALFKNGSLSLWGSF